MNVSPGVGASQRVGVAEGLGDGVEHDDACWAADIRLNDGSEPALGVVMPEVVEPGCADDGLADLVPVQAVYGGELHLRGVADDEPGNPEGTSHCMTVGRWCVVVAELD